MVDAVFIAYFTLNILSCMLLVMLTIHDVKKNRHYSLILAYLSTAFQIANNLVYSFAHIGPILNGALLPLDSFCAANAYISLYARFVNAFSLVFFTFNLWFVVRTSRAAFDPRRTPTYVAIGILLPATLSVSLFHLQNTLSTGFGLGSVEPATYYCNIRLTFYCNVLQCTILFVVGIISVTLALHTSYMLYKYRSTLPSSKDDDTTLVLGKGLMIRMMLFTTMLGLFYILKHVPLIWQVGSTNVPDDTNIQLYDILTGLSVNGLGYFFIFGTTGEFFAMYLPCFHTPEQPLTDEQLNDFSKPSMIRRLARVLQFGQRAPKNGDKEYFDDLMERQTVETVEMGLEVAIKG